MDVSEAADERYLPFLHRLWGDRDLSDVKLCILQCQDGDCEEKDEPVVCDAHSQVLVGGSEYFLAKVKNWRNGIGVKDDTQTRDGMRKLAELVADPHRMVLNMNIERNEDPAAALAAVRYLYFGHLDEEVRGKPTMLLQVAHIADAFLMPACVQACGRALSALPPEQLLSSCCLGQVLQLPQVYKPSLGFGAAVAAAARELLKQVGATSPAASDNTQSSTPLTASFINLMGSVPHLIATPDLLTTFMKLPFEWVLWWASSDQLATDHENSVALLLLTWIKSQRHNVSHKELLGQIRMRHLSTSYLASVVPVAVKQAGQKDLDHTLTFFHTLHRASSTFPAADVTCSVPLPKPWLQPEPRRRATGSFPQLPASFTLHVPEARLAELMQQASKEDSKAAVLHAKCGQYSSGWWLRPYVQIKKVAETQGFDVGIYVEVAEQLPGCMALSAAVSQPPGPYTALAHVEYVCQKADGTQKLLSSLGLFPCPGPLGCATFLTPQPVSSSEGLGEFLVEGELRFRVTVKAVE